MQESPRPGTIVWVPAYMVFRHRGIVSDERDLFGRPFVISASGHTGRVCEEPWDVFTGGQACQVEGYPSQLPPSIVVERARSLMGQVYDLFSRNCDHLVTFAHGQEPNSPQLVGALSVGVVAVAWVWAARQV